MSAPLPPNLSYLSRTLSATILSNGTADVDFRPDVGQYWLPTLVHVGANTPGTLYCELHSGAVAALGLATTSKDFTFKGTNDTSTILSGTVLSAGEGIRCHFINGVPGTVVFAEIAGLSSVIPPTEGIIPVIPGVRFTGNTVDRLQTTLVTQKSFTGMTGGGGFINVGPFDMRDFASFGLAFDAQSTANATNFNPLLFLLIWTDDTTLGQVVFEQQFSIFAADPNNTFGIYGRVEFQDAVHGKFLTVFIENTGGDTLRGAYEVFGSLAQLTTPYLRNTPTVGTNSPLNGAAFDFDPTHFDAGGAINAGVTTLTALPMFPGPATIFIQGNVASFLFLLTDALGKTISILRTPIAATTELHQQLTLPASALKLQISNTGGGNGSALYAVTVSRPQVGT